MPSEFEDPRLAPLRARAIGGRQFLRWAIFAAALGAAAANLDTAAAILGAAPATQAFPVPGAGGNIFALQFLAGAAPAFLVVGAGLALAATMEVRRAAAAAGSGSIPALWIAWTLLAMGALGLLFPAGNP